MAKKLIMGAAIGNCVHVAGVAHFLELAGQEGYETLFLGPAVSVDAIFENIGRYRPHMVGISYRLTPESVRPLLDEIYEKSQRLLYSPVWVFGGTKPVADIAKSYGLFSFVSDGSDDAGDAIRFLRGMPQAAGLESYGKTLKERVEKSRPYPILRHHFGLPSLEKTIKGIKDISDAKVLDVISLGPDQNAQQYLFNRTQMDRRFDGAGGVPIRCAEDFIRLKKASERGNYPLMRCYSGTEDVFKYAELLLDTIDNAWAAIPLFWYGELDGRGTRPVEICIAQALQLIRWHAEKGIPVEINDPHHWGMRDAHDVIPVAVAYICAYNAKKSGVKNYVAQYMFNNPSGESFPMDFARVLAMIEMVESLQDSSFTVYRETRAGLPLFSVDRDIAKGQLAASVFMQMAVKPHIVHVVSFCEADHAATAEEVMESCKIVKGVVRHTLNESFSIENDEKISRRKNELVGEAHVLLDFVLDRFSEYHDPLSNPQVLAECVKRGYFDAPHIVKNDRFTGTLATRFVDGKCMAYDRQTGMLLSESERLAKLDENHKNK